MSRRWRYPKARRGAFLRVVAVQAPPVQPSWVQGIQEPAGRSSRPRPVRRGRFWTVVPPAVVQPAGLVPRWLEPAGRTARCPRARRAAFYQVPPATPVQVAAWVPVAMRSRRPPATPTRRPRLWALPAQTLSPLALVQRRRPAAVFPRRGRFLQVPPVPQLAGPGPWPPRITRPSTRRLMLPRRAEFWTVPLAGAAPTPPPAVPPQILRPRTRHLIIRRGRRWPVPPAVALPVPWTPPMLGARTATPRPVRRSRLYAVPRVTITASVLPPLALTRRARRLPATRRATFIEPAWPAIPPAAYTPVTDPVSAIRPNLAIATTRANAAAAVTRANPAEAAT